MLQNLSGWHALVILTIVLLVFGSAKLPALAKSVGESMRILKDETKEDRLAPAQAGPAAGTSASYNPSIASAPFDATADRRAS